MRDGVLGRGHERVASALEPSGAQDNHEGTGGAEEGEKASCGDRARAGLHRGANAFYSNRKIDHEKSANAYSNAMEKVYQKYSEDHEAAVFYALSLLADEPEVTQRLPIARRPPRFWKSCLTWSRIIRESRTT